MDTWTVEQILESLAAALGADRDAAADDLLEAVRLNTLSAQQHRRDAELRAAASADLGWISGLRVMSAGGERPTVRLGGHPTAVQAAARLLYHPDLVIGLRPTSAPSRLPPGWTADDDVVRSPSAAWALTTRESEEEPGAWWVVLEGDQRSSRAAAEADLLRLAWAIECVPPAHGEPTELARVRSELELRTIEREGALHRLEVVTRAKDQNIEHLKLALRAEAGDLTVAPSAGWRVGRGVGVSPIYWLKTDDAERYSLRVTGGLEPSVRIFDLQTGAFVHDASTPDAYRGMLEADGYLSDLLAANTGGTP